METKRILIVDDEPNIVMSLEYLMRSKGLEVGIARSGSEALDQMEQSAYDLVLLDITMPDLDGYHVCQTIKNHPVWKQTHVVFLSAKSKQSDIEKGMSLGATDYIVKPFSTKDLSKRILDILEA
jgi:DNA-binding response OmpR family regulator